MGREATVALAKTRGWSSDRIETSTDQGATTTPSPLKNAWKDCTPDPPVPRACGQFLAVSRTAAASKTPKERWLGRNSRTINNLQDCLDGEVRDAEHSLPRGLNSVLGTLFHRCTRQSLHRALHFSCLAGDGLPSGWRTGENPSACSPFVNLVKGGHGHVRFSENSEPRAGRV